ncbi:unnamed protein product [Triticum turgidum subsp. durum]|uniref:Uncharacterized protein n=1 Tax=Triticum turgidum subsp. durum TaxID=4567 RepID=A0A9R1P457_TRITD|nr:unnamed protein product [Triticum turgidum subsp. durum]
MADASAGNNAGSTSNAEVQIQIPVVLVVNHRATQSRAGGTIQELRRQELAVVDDGVGGRLLRRRRPDVHDAAGEITSVGVVGLVFEVSSLFSNVISTVSLPIVPLFAVLIFHDTMDGIKIISMLIAAWGFVSYLMQHFIDDKKARKAAAGG